MENSSPSTGEKVSPPLVALVVPSALPRSPTVIQSAPSLNTQECASRSHLVLNPLAIDIEHVPVNNDPRTWSPLRKNVSMALIASASMISGLAANIQNPAVQEMEADLPATSAQFSLSLSLFILIQGCVPLLWSTISEVRGRKVVYVSSLALFTLGTIVVAISEHIGLVIGFRCLQAVGSSAVMSIGAASLADIFDPVERGRKMGIYYIAPLLGPAIGPIFGGVLTTAFNWRAIFWFLALVSGTSLLSFMLFFQDTFRRERSLIYHNIIKQRLMTDFFAPLPAPLTKHDLSDTDIEKGSLRKAVDNPQQFISNAMSTMKLSITDINPFIPIGQVLRRKNNITVLIPSGLLFAYGLLVAYTSSRTLSKFYGYNPLKIGLVVLCYGVGCVAGSFFGGRWSDRQLAQLKERNHGKSYPEMRLRSTLIGVAFLPLSVLAYGWVCEKRLHVSAICITLFFSGFFNIWIYSSTLAYIVDANNGRSATAAAANSAFRGVSAFVATELAVPLQDSLGDGWMYSIWALIMLVTGMFILLAWWKGGQWREEAESREAEHADQIDRAILRRSTTMSFSS